MDYPRVLFFIALAVGAVYIGSQQLSTHNAHSEGVALSSSESGKNQDDTRVEHILIEPGATFGVLMEQAGVPPIEHMAIHSVARDVYDLADIRAGKELELVFDNTTNQLRKLVYKFSNIQEVVVERETVTKEVIIQNEDDSLEPSQTEHTEQDVWRTREQHIPYDIRTKTISGIISSSLYETGLEQGMDERAIIALADVFQWSVDYAWGVRTGDTFTVIYEERYLNDEYIMPGKVLAAVFVNGGKEYQAYYYEASEEQKGYFNELGESVQKVFLKAPLAFKYISSGFTTKPRYVSSMLGWTKNHTAIDYAAPSGTPVRAVGDGVVSSAGWSSEGYGNLITLRHNSVYSTNYAHLSKMYVRSGEQVKQGDVIGAVGSTGFSSGPHLHYEMVKHGSKINPLTEEFPSADAIPQEQHEQYQSSIAEYHNKLIEN